MSFRPSVIINLDAYRGKPAAPRQPDFATLGTLQEAERLTDLVSDDVQAGICNAVAGARKLGGLADGRTLSFSVRLCLALMQLRTHPADLTLRLAMEEWLYQKGNGA